MSARGEAQNDLQLEKDRLKRLTTISLSVTAYCLLALRRIWAVN